MARTCNLPLTIFECVMLSYMIFVEKIIFLPISQLLLNYYLIRNCNRVLLALYSCKLFKCCKKKSQFKKDWKILDISMISSFVFLNRISKRVIPCRYRDPSYREEKTLWKKRIEAVEVVTLSARCNNDHQKE